jgi:hypothetical protein
MAQSPIDNLARSHPIPSLPTSEQRKSAKITRWRSPPNSAYAPSSPTATSASASSTGAQASVRGQQRLGPIQGLHLRLLVHAQDDGVDRGAEVQPDDIVDLLLQPGIGAALEGLQPVGLQGMAPPDPMHRAERHAGPSPSHPLSARATPPSRLLRQDAHGLEMWWITPVSPLVGVGRIRA